MPEVEEKTGIETPQVEEEIKEEATPSTEEVKPEEVSAEKDKEVESEIPPESLKDEEPKKKSFQQRLNQLTKEKYEALRTAEFYKEKAMQTLTSEVVLKPKPKEENFDSQEAYIDALTDWKVEQAKKELREESVRERETEKKKAIDSEFEKRADKARERYEDFDEVFYDVNVPYTEVMREIVKTDDFGAEIGYYLGKNQHEADRIAHLSAIQQVSELAKLSMRLSQPLKTQRKVISNAPEPVKPIGSKGEITKGLYDDNLPYEVYKAERMKNMK